MIFREFSVILDNVIMMNDEVHRYSKDTLYSNYPTDLFGDLNGRWMLILNNRPYTDSAQLTPLVGEIRAKA